MKALYALYSDPDAAQFAVNSLKLSGGSLGITESQIAVVTSEPFDGYDFSDEHARTRIFLIASIGGVFGALLGLLFVRFTQLVYPLPTGGMPITPRWTNGIIMYETTMLGAILNHRRHPPGHRPPASFWQAALRPGNLAGQDPRWRHRPAR